MTHESSPMPTGAEKEARTDDADLYERRQPIIKRVSPNAMDAKSPESGSAQLGKNRPICSIGAYCVGRETVRRERSVEKAGIANDRQRRRISCDRVPDPSATGGTNIKALFERAATGRFVESFRHPPRGCH